MSQIGFNGNFMYRIPDSTGSSQKNNKHAQRTRLCPLNKGSDLDINTSVLLINLLKVTVPPPVSSRYINRARGQRSPRWHQPEVVAAPLVGLNSSCLHYKKPIKNFFCFNLSLWSNQWLHSVMAAEKWHRSMFRPVPCKPHFHCAVQSGLEFSSENKGCIPAHRERVGHCATKPGWGLLSTR